jgi:glycosyltransferase involved in cell wall biosynthesis
MHIAMVGPFGLHPNKTMRSRAFGLARPLVQRGHEVKILMPPWQTPEKAGQEWQEDGVIMRYTSLNGGTLGTTVRLVRETLAWQPDVVHAFKPKAYSGLAAWWLWRFHRRRVRLVTDTDDWEGWGGWNDIAPYSTVQKKFFAWQERWGMQHCHALTVASRTLQSLAWANGVDPKKVIYVPNGPGIGDDISQAADKRAGLGLADRPVILLYSRLFEFETARLVSILQQVRAAIPEVAILTVGMSLYKEDAGLFKEQLEAAGLEELIVDVGWLDEAELPQVVTAADVGLYLMEDTLLNRTKCPVKVADMLSVGLPVVAEAVGQVPEYVRHGQTGLLRSSGDVTGVATDLVELLSDEKQRVRLATGARAHIQAQFTWERLADRVEEAYQGIAQEPSTNKPA